MTRTSGLAPPHRPGVRPALLALTACVALSLPLTVSPVLGERNVPTVAQEPLQAPRPRVTATAATRSHVRPVLPTPTVRQVTRRPAKSVTRTGHYPATQSAVTAIIRKAAVDAGISVPGLLALTWCESRWHPDSYRPGNGASGLGQHLARYWPARARAYGYPGSSPFDATANANVTARMIRSGGVGPWEHKCAQAYRNAR